MSSEEGESDLIVAKELTKLHEKIERGKVSEIAGRLEALKGTPELKGEWCFAMIFKRISEEVQTDAEDFIESNWFKALKCLHDGDVPPSRAAAIVSQQFGIPRRDVYRARLSADREFHKKG